MTTNGAHARWEATTTAISRHVQARPFTPEHRDQVFALYAQVFGHEAGAAFRERWSWSLEENLYPEESPRWVLEARGRVVGFLAALPQPYWVYGKEMIAHTPCDYVVDPEYRFHGIHLLRAFSDACENRVANEDSRDGVPAEWLGASEVATVHRSVKVLNARALVPRNAGPAPLHWAAGLALALSGRLRTPSSPVAVSITYVFDARFDIFADALARCSPIMAVKDTRYLRWRYGPSSPHANRRIGVATDWAGDLTGYVVFHCSRGTAPIGRILDLQYLPDAGPAVGTSLLAHAERELRQEGAWTVHHRQVDTPTGVQPDVLSRAGYMRHGGQRLLVRFANAGVQTVAERAEHWRLGYGDGAPSHAAL